MVVGNQSETAFSFGTCLEKCCMTGNIQDIELKVKVDRSISLDRLLAVQAAARGIEEKLLEAKDEIQITGEELTYCRS
jgi:hypothetical protein